MQFLEGDNVEVITDIAGFYGTYWAATVIQKLDSTNEYVVEYKNLKLEEDCSPPQEVVPGDHIRPVPPEYPVACYKLKDQVDVYHSSGWWTATIAGEEEGDGSYYVEFEGFEIGVMYDASQIRMHQDWSNGDWTVPARVVTNYEYFVRKIEELISFFGFDF